MVERHVTAETIRARLTPELQRLADTVGLEAVLLLLAARGGTNVYIPHRSKSDTELCRLVGEEAAARFSDTMPGTYLKLPACKQALVMYWTEKGLSRMEVARELRLDQRSVHRILAELDTRQIDLFPTP